MTAIHIQMRKYTSRKNTDGMVWRTMFNPETEKIKENCERKHIYFGYLFIYFYLLIIKNNVVYIYFALEPYITL